MIGAVTIHLMVFWTSKTGIKYHCWEIPTFYGLVYPIVYPIAVPVFQENLPTNGIPTGADHRGDFQHHHAELQLQYGWEGLDWLMSYEKTGE